MREAVRDLGGDPGRIEPLAPSELVIDHSVIADFFGLPDAEERNVELEYERNRERYQFLRWGQSAFEEFKVVSVFELLREYIETGRIKVDRSRHPHLTTVHDPCNYGRKSQMSFGDHHCDNSRWIVSQCCENMVEMIDGPLNNLCCGAGGGA